MSPASPFKRTRRATAGLAAVLALGLAAAPGASADFSLAPCTGEGIFARGASFQTEAVAAFFTNFKAPANCGSSAPAVTYDPAGSGAGRRSLGERNATTNPSGDRDPSVRFAGADEAPTPSQRAQIEAGPIDANGADVTSADNGKLHVIPVAIGAVTVMVNMPQGCATYGSNPTFRDRPQITNTVVEQIFAGTATWGAVLPGVTPGPGCADLIVKRVVRKDDSGTTFALKQLLQRINPARGWSALANTQWPNDAGPTAVIRPAENGGGNLRNLLVTDVRDTGGDGAMGYADLATSRGSSGAFLFNTASPGGYDDKYYLSLQVQNTSTFRDPQVSADGYRITGSTPALSGGANCFNAQVKNPGDSSFGDWSNTDSTYSPLTNGEGDYNDCALTYDLAFDDNSTVYCNSASEERKARTVKDFLQKGAVSASGQDALPGANYGRLPSDVLGKARAGADAIGWKKGTDGRPCTASPSGTPAPTTTTNTVFVPIGSTPPPAAVSNAFTLSVRYSRNRVRTTLQLPGAGTFTVSPVATPKKGRAIKLSRSTTTVSSAGTQRVSFALNTKAKKALKRFKSLKIRVAVAFTPKGGSAARKTKTITIRAKRR